MNTELSTHLRDGAREAVERQVEGMELLRPEDIADTVTFDRIHSAVQSLKIAEMQTFEPAEIFRGGAVPQGKYSVLLRARFQSSDRTLTDDDVATWSAQIVKALEALGGSLRK